MIIDELYTYISNKKKRFYVWAAVAITITGKKFYYYHLSRNKTTQALFLFNQDLPKANTIYSDGNFAYDSVYGKKVIQKKSKMTNIIENLNSQMRDKISYLVRRTKAYSKSKNWLDYRLALFFNSKNLGLY